MNTPSKYDSCIFWTGLSFSHKTGAELAGKNVSDFLLKKEGDFILKKEGKFLVFPVPFYHHMHA